MPIDKSTLERLQSLDDETLAHTVSELAAAAGISPQAIAPILGNLPALRRMLATVSPDDLARGISMLGGSRGAEMMRRMNGER